MKLIDIQWCIEELRNIYIYIYMFEDSHMYKTKVLHEIEDLELCEVIVGKKRKW